MAWRMRTTYTERGYKFEVDGNEAHITSFAAMKKISIPLVNGELPPNAVAIAMRELRAFEAMKKATREATDIG